MKKFNLKNVFVFLFFFLIYIVPYFFIQRDLEFYNSLTKINISSFVFIVVWTVIYTLMSLYLMGIYKKISLKDKRLIAYLVINYLANICYVLFFFQFKLLFWSFIWCVVSFLSILFVWMETILFNKKLSYLLIVNVLWSLFACFLSGYVYLFN